MFAQNCSQIFSFEHLPSHAPISTIVSDSDISAMKAGCTPSKWQMLKFKMLGFRK